MIRTPAAIKCARELLEASGSPIAGDERAVLNAASFIQNCVKADELGLEVERKETVLKLIGGNDGNRV